MSEKRTVFFHDVSTSYPASVLGGLSSIPEYATRVLAMTDEKDVVILPESVRPHLRWIQEHYKAIGLPHAGTILFGGYDLVSRLHDHELSVFLFGVDAHRVRPNQRRFEATARHNDKNEFVCNICSQMQIPTPQTFCVREPRPIGQLVDAAHEIGWPLYVKAALSASGLDVFQVSSWEELLVAVGETHIANLQLQAALPEGTKFLNVQYCNRDGYPSRGPITRQVLKGFSHNGNIFPAGVDEEAVWRVTDPLAKYAVEEGLEQVWAYDVGYLPDGSVQVVECNPRANGCTYFSEVARKLNVHAWEARNVKFLPGTFEGCELGDLAFREGRGIVIVNWGFVAHQKLGLFIAGTETEREAYCQAFHRKFNQTPQLRSVG